MVAGAVLWAVTLAAALPEIWQHGSLRRVPGWYYSRPTQPNQRVTLVTPGGPADGILRVGDRILSIDGKAGYTGVYSPSIQIWGYPAGRTYQARIDRGGQILDVTLQIASRPGSQWPLIASLLFGSLTFAAIGWLMGWQKPESLTARLGWIASQLTAFVYLSLALAALQDQGWKPSVLLSLLRMLSQWHFWFAFWFVAEFPYPLPPSSLWRGIRYALAVPCCVAWILVVWVNLAFIAGPPWHAQLPVWWTTFYFNSMQFCVLSLGIAVVAVLIRNYRFFRRDPLARRQIELVAGAIAFAVCTLGIAGGLGVVRNQTPSPFFNLAPLPVPLCFAYAVLRHRVLDLRVVIHRSLQYLLARQLLRALTLLPLALMVIRAIADPTAPIGSLFNIVGIALVAASALALEFRERLHGALNRWYQRPALDREKKLRELAAEIAGLSSWQEIEALVPPRLIAIFDAESAGFDTDGALQLGVKKSGEEYTDSEQQLLELVRAQIRLVWEKAMLTESHSAAIQSERQRIAREIHDTAGHGFAGIALYMDAARKTFHAGASSEASQFLEEAGALARKSLQDTRASIAGLREPASVDLAARLQLLTARNHAGPPFVSVHVEPDAVPRASEDVRWHLARIAEEAVANACRHASATQIRVELQSLAEGVRLRVHDDGQGFNTAEMDQRGYGLSGMKERTEQLQGRLTIVSAPGQGTEICAEVPA